MPASPSVNVTHGCEPPGAGTTTSSLALQKLVRQVAKIFGNILACSVEGSTDVFAQQHEIPKIKLHVWNEVADALPPCIRREVR